MKNEKGRPFLEIFAFAVNEDYRFPILQIFAFLYTLATFVFAYAALDSSIESTGQSATTAYTLASGVLTFPLYIFIVLIFKNIAYGIGNDIDNGIIQIYLAYPIKRSRVLTAKLLSALGISFVTFFGIQLFGLYLLASGIVMPYISTILITYAANLSFPLFIAGVMLLIALILKRGSLAIVVGILLYFALIVISTVLSVLANTTGLWTVMEVLSLLSPNLAVSAYYQSLSPYHTVGWKPGYAEVLAYAGASYAIVAVVFALAYMYFSRRFSS